MSFYGISTRTVAYSYEYGTVWVYFIIMLLIEDYTTYRVIAGLCGGPAALATTPIRDI